jgi:hypothetical protein
MIEKHYTKLFYCAFLLFELFYSPSMSSSSVACSSASSSTSSSSSLSDSSASLPPQSRVGYGNLEILKFNPGKCKPPWKEAALEKVLYEYDYIALSMMVWGSTPEFLHFFGMARGWEPLKKTKKGNKNSKCLDERDYLEWSWVDFGLQIQTIPGYGEFISI